jgi:hypothetical protein
LSADGLARLVAGVLPDQVIRAFAVFGANLGRTRCETCRTRPWLPRSRAARGRSRVPVTAPEPSMAAGLLASSRRSKVESGGTAATARPRQPKEAFGCTTSLCTPAALPSTSTRSPGSHRRHLPARRPGARRRVPLGRRRGARLRTPGRAAAADTDRRSAPRRLRRHLAASTRRRHVA